MPLLMKTVEKSFTLFSIVFTFAALVALPTPAPELNEPLTDFITYALLLMGLGAFVLVTWTEEEPAAQTELTREIPVTAFDTLDVSGAFKVLVTRGEVPRVVLRGTPRQVNGLRVRQTGPALVLSSRDWLTWWQGTALITVTMPALRLLDASGVGQVRVEGFEAFAHTTLDVSGAADVTFTGRGERLSVEVAGAARLTLQGEAERLDADLSGACSLSAFSFPAPDVSLELSGVCSAQVRALTRLRADLSGASSLRYRGQPLVEIQTTGASSVTQA
jgi:hypothetical protein